MLIAPAGGSGPAFLMLRNHFVIKRYNNSTAYSLAVGHLADRLRGGGDFAQPWPNGERPLTADEDRRSCSNISPDAGYYDGEIDGKLGPASRAAIRAFQSGRGMIADGFAGLQLLETLAERLIRTVTNATTTLNKWMTRPAAHSSLRAVLRPGGRDRRMIRRRSSFAPLALRAVDAARSSWRRTTRARAASSAACSAAIVASDSGRRAQRRSSSSPASTRRAGNRAASGAARARTARRSRAKSRRSRRRANAKRALVIGDFMAAALAKGLADAYRENANVVVIDASSGSSGLVRNDYLRLAGEGAGARRRAEAGRDPRHDRRQRPADDATAAGAQALGSDGWRAAYTARVAALADALKATGKPVLWGGLVPVESKRHVARLQLPSTASCASSSTPRACASSTCGTALPTRTGNTSPSGRTCAGSWCSSGPTTA